MVALYIGGMGAKGQELLQRPRAPLRLRGGGREIQDLYLDGKKDEAAAKVPDELLELTNLVRPGGLRQGAHRRLRARPGVTVLNVTPVGADPVKLVEKLKAWTE